MSDYQPTPPTSTPYASAGYPQAQKSPTLSILAMVFGILGVLGALFYGIGFLPALAGVILGFLGKRKEPAAKGFWLTGIITGFVGIAISLIVVVGVIIFVAVVANNPGAFSTSP